MCLLPIAIKPEGQLARVVPCGKCHDCHKKRASSWAFRVEQEQLRSTTSCFLTLTYESSPLSQNGLQTLKKQHFQQFLKRLRHQVPFENYTKKDGSTGKRSNIKYYACGEYGSQYHRPHYHAIIFNLPKDWINSSDKLHQTWNKGHIQIDPCNGATIRYVTNYITKSENTIFESWDDRLKEFNLMSKGLGRNYLSPQIIHHHRSKLINYITRPSGLLIALPRYYKDYLFDDEMKEILLEAAAISRETNFEKLFNNSITHKLLWIKDQKRKNKKELSLKRNKSFSKDNSPALIQDASEKLTTSYQKQLLT